MFTRCIKVLRTSAFRLTLLYAGIFCASFIALFAIIYWSTARYMDRQLDDTVGNEIAEIESDVANGSVASLQNIVSGLTLQLTRLFLICCKITTEMSWRETFLPCPR